jgi:sulfoxide reductase heme-binding subunit YedZ
MKKTKKTDWLRISIHIIGVIPLLQLIWLTLMHKLTPNPIQFLTQMLGLAAVNMLVLSLAITPIVTVTGWRALIKHRRTVGLYTFLYFALHFTMFAVVDYALNLKEILRQIPEKPFILIGFTAGTILLLLAITSFKYWMRQMGKGWQSLHRTVYLAGILVVLHYALAVKGNLANLSGNIARPLTFGLIITILLVMRISPIRRWLSGLRYKIKFPRSQPAHPETINPRREASQDFTKSR